MKQPKNSKTSKKLMTFFRTLKKNKDSIRVLMIMEWISKWMDLMDFLDFREPRDSETSAKFLKCLVLEWEVEHLEDFLKREEKMVSNKQMEMILEDLEDSLLQDFPDSKDFSKVAMDKLLHLKCEAHSLIFN